MTSFPSRYSVVSNPDKTVWRDTAMSRLETPARLALGFTRTIYQVPRAPLQGAAGIDIEHGGLQIGTPPPVPTEPVVCNVATLVIGARPRYSVFYGDALPGESWDDVQPDRGGGAGEDPEE